MVSDAQVERSRAIQQRTGRTFYLATRLLPERVRHATYVLYAFFRLADEVVDDVNGETPAEQREMLERIRAAALGEREAEEPVLQAFSELRERYGIDDADVNTFVDAMCSDIRTDRYATYAELEAYMDGSAAAVGRMMTAVMQPDDAAAALPHATALGEAFQLSNFLRDVREDIVERDRIYLPQETLHRHGVTEEQLLDFRLTDGFRDAMREEMDRAEALYRDGVAGIQYLPRDCQFAVLLAAVLYASHHRKIRGLGYDVLSETPQLGTFEKLTLLARTGWHWARTNDPETVFRRVGVVSYPEPSFPDASTDSEPVSNSQPTRRIASRVRSLIRLD